MFWFQWISDYDSFRVLKTRKIFEADINQIVIC